MNLTDPRLRVILRTERGTLVSLGQGRTRFVASPIFTLTRWLVVVWVGVLLAVGCYEIADKGWRG